MSGKHHRSPISDDESFRLTLGKIDKLNLIESLYRRALKENEELKTKLASLEASGNTEVSANVRRSDSVTQLLLNATDTRPLEHPTEFFEVLEKEKREEIELLKKECENSTKELEKVQQQRDHLQHEVENLQSTMKDLKDRYPSSSSWENIKPQSNLAEREFDEQETFTLRRKVDELQDRVKELLNHNEKWNTLCKGLQDELDAVRGQLQQYQKAEARDQVTLLADLKDQMEKTEQAEKNANLARQHIKELEVRICDLERELKEKEQREIMQAQQENETIRDRVEEEVQAKASFYEEQLKAYQEDFENERHDHEITKKQLDSMRKQWESIRAELVIKIQQLNDKTKQLEDKEKENKRLQEQLEQALGDECLIRKRASEFQRRSSPMLSEWTCTKCTYINTRDVAKCALCETSRERGKTPEDAVKKPPKKQGRLEEDGVCVKKSKWPCNKCTFRNTEDASSCIMCATTHESHRVGKF